MFISDFAIKKPLVTTVAMLTLAVFGLFALLKLKTDEFPDVAPPVVSVANGSSMPSRSRTARKSSSRRSVRTCVKRGIG